MRRLDCKFLNVLLSGVVIDIKHSVLIREVSFD